MINLKEYTQDLHNKVEECYYPKQLFNTQITKDEYTIYLSIFYTIHQQIEEQFEQFSKEWELFDFDYKSYNRLDLIALDLKNLNQDIQKTPTLEIKISSFAEALGFMYVLTGSTMGGALLSAKVKQTPQLKEFNSINNYFLAYKDETMTKWKRFMELLGGFMGKNPHEAKIIADGSRRCFELMIKGLDYGK